MDSLEALEEIITDYKELCDDARNNDIEYQLGNLTSPYHTIKRNLEVLNELKILRDYYPPFKEFLTKMLKDGYNGDLKHIKEWLNG